MVAIYDFKGDAVDAVKQLDQALISAASNQLKVGREDLTVRDLRPQDVGLGTSEWTFSVTAATSTNVVGTSIASGRWLGVYGVRYAGATQSVSELKVTKEGKDVRYWNVQGTAFLQDQTIYFTDPVTVKELATLTIAAYPVTTNTAEKMILLGRVVEKKGLLVQD